MESARRQSSRQFDAQIAETHSVDSHHIHYADSEYSTDIVTSL